MFDVVCTSQKKDRKVIKRKKVDRVKRIEKRSVY